MIRRLSLSQRLALVVVSLLMLCAVAVCAVQLHSSAQYGNAMVQRLSSGLAQQIVAREPLLDAHGEVNRQTLKSLFDRLMTFNPSVELYLLSPDGDLLADAAPPGHIQRQRIDMAPVQAFLTGSASPVYGDDPRSPDGRKVFSAAPLRVDGQLRGYLYIILQGRRLISWRPTPGKNAVEHCSVDAAAGGPVWPAGRGLAWFWVTRPVRLLTAQVAASGQDSISAIKPWRPAGRSPGLVTRWRCSRTALLTLPGRLPISGIGWPTAIASAVNLWPISLTICARR